MQDLDYILNVLRINGVNASSNLSEVEHILDTLRYTAEEKQKALEMLKTRGWELKNTPGAVVQDPAPATKQTPPTSNQPANIPVDVQVSNSVTTPNPFQVQNPAPTFNVNQNVAHKTPKFFLLVIVVLFVVLGGGLVAFAYVQKIGPFEIATQYEEGNFFTKLFEKSSAIKSSVYTASASLEVENRDADAKPFTIQISNEAEIAQQYQDDYIRSGDVSSILSSLRAYGYDAYTKSFKPYPTSLSSLLTDQKGQGYYQRRMSVSDPVTKKSYDYKVTKGGKDFTLTVTFDTSSAINSIMKYSTATSTTLVGRQVTFTKDSSSYLYLSSTPPKPYLIQMGGLLRQLSPDVNGSVAISAASELNDGVKTNWKFNLDAQGSLGDLTYKLNGDLLKKDSDYYFKINNIPSLFGSYGSFKGQWIRVPSSDSKDSGTAPTTASYMTQSLYKYESAYKENKDKFILGLKNLAMIADQLKTISFKESPKYEKVDGIKLTKYSISLRKESIIALLKQLQDIHMKDKESGYITKYSQLLDDPGLIDYLNSPEFDQVYDYQDKNTAITFWVDDQGYPAILEYSMRIVPPDTAVQLKDKQIRLVFKLKLNDINKSVKIEAPEKSITIDEATKQLKSNYSDASASAKLKSNLSTLRASAEIAWDKNQGYGTKAFSLGPCSQTSGTLFADKGVFDQIKEATNNEPSSAKCASELADGKVGSYAVSVPLPDSPKYSWCVDSSGLSTQIPGSIKSASCR